MHARARLLPDSKRDDSWVEQNFILCVGLSRKLLVRVSIIGSPSSCRVSYF